MFHYLKNLLFKKSEEGQIENNSENKNIEEEVNFLIIGLGNIGEKYENTRHNIGFDVVDELAKKHNAKWELDRLAFMSKFKFKSRNFYLIKPTTYMNLSGKAVKLWMDKLKIKPENILVVVDDLSLDFGMLRLRTKGSAGGHNGLKNIETVLQSSKYSRIKFGIGNNFSKGKQVNFVLGEWNKRENEELPFLIDKATNMCEAFCTIGASHTMSQFNGTS